MKPNKVGISLLVKDASAYVPFWVPSCWRSPSKASPSRCTRANSEVGGGSMGRSGVYSGGVGASEGPTKRCFPESAMGFGVTSCLGGGGDILCLGLGFRVQGL